MHPVSCEFKNVKFLSENNKTGVILTLVLFALVHLPRVSQTSEFAATGNPGVPKEHWNDVAKLAGILNMFEKTVLFRKPCNNTISQSRKMYTLYKTCA